jgi:hypothetical protein
MGVMLAHLVSVLVEILHFFEPVLPKPRRGRRTRRLAVALLALVLPASAQQQLVCTPGFAGSTTCQPQRAATAQRFAIGAAVAVGTGTVIWALTRGHSGGHGHNAGKGKSKAAKQLAKLKGER